jgi:hypothetical protein
MLKDREAQYIRRYLSTAALQFWPAPSFEPEEQDIKRGLLRQHAIEYRGTDLQWKERVLDLYSDWLTKRGWKVEVA